VDLETAAKKVRYRNKIDKPAVFDIKPERMAQCRAL